MCGLCGVVSFFPTFLVSKLASREEKVVLSGDGGDELFAGYDTYLTENWIDTVGTYPGPYGSRFFQNSPDGYHRLDNSSMRMSRRIWQMTF